MPFPSSALFALLALTSWPALSQEVSLLIQRSTLAGYKYYEARAWAGALRPGETLDLVREPHNPYDANAVRVEWQGRKLGYVPRAGNAALAWAMDGGESVTARVARDDAPRRTRRRVVFEILLR